MTDPNQNKTKKQTLIKFVLLCLLLVGYFVYLSLQYGLLTGGMGALLTWSFFVLCTPVADAGFLLDFPLRLLFGIKMVTSEIVVWAMAISMNVACFFYAAHYYDTTLITRLLHKILQQPYPYWGVILLSGAGTFLSVKFGDEMFEAAHHRDRDFFHSHQFKIDLILIAFFIVVFFGYYELIASLGIEIPQE